MKLYRFLLVFFVAGLVLSPLSSEAVYEITETQLTALETNLKEAQTELMKSQEECQTLKTELQTVSQLLKKSESDRKKQIIKYTALGVAAGVTSGYIIGKLK